MTYSAGSGDTRVTLNEHPHAGGLTVEVRGVACTVMLSPAEMLALAKALCDLARKVK